MIEYTSPFGLAIIYSHLGDKDRAFANLEIAYGERDEEMTNWQLNHNLTRCVPILGSPISFGGSEFQADRRFYFIMPTDAAAMIWSVAWEL